VFGVEGSGRGREFVKPRTWRWATSTDQRALFGPTATVRVGYTVLPNLLILRRGGAAWVAIARPKVDLVTGLLEGHRKT